MNYNNYMKIKWSINEKPKGCDYFYNMMEIIKNTQDSNFIKQFLYLCHSYDIDIEELCLQFAMERKWFDFEKVGKVNVNVLNEESAFIFSIKTKLNLFGFDYERQKLNVQKCGEFFMKNAHIFRNDEDIVYIYNYESGLYEELTDVLFGKIFVSIVDVIACDYSVWNSYKENEVYKYVCRLAQPYINHDKDIYIIPVQNGLVDLRNMSISPFSPKHFFISKSPIEYTLNAECEEFKKAMLETCSHDKEKLSLLQEWFGVGFIRNALHGKILFMFGDGASGKSTVADLISMLYSRVSNLTLSNISQRFELVNMLGSEINIGHENSNVATDFDPNVFKIIATGDPITLAVKHKKGIQTRITTKCMFLFNNILEIGSIDSSMGFWRRVCLIEFTNSFLEGGEKDLAKQLMKKEGSGILRFALEGAKRLIENHYEFSKCESSIKALEKYKQSQNPLRKFLDDEIELNDNSKVTRRQLRSRFIKYCEKECISSNGFERPQIMWREFERWSKETYQKKFRQYKTSSDRGYYGIKLKEW